MRFDEDADFKKRAYEGVVKLQARESDYFKAWQMICDVSKNGKFKFLFNCVQWMRYYS